jgi:phage terminase small subunit
MAPVSAPRGGRNGRPPTPTPLRLLQGNPGKRRIPPEAPPKAGPTGPPPGLSPPAAEVWLRLAPELVAKKLLAPRYVDSFAVLCESVVAWQRAAALVAAAGPVIQRDGVVVSNPASREFARYAYLVRAGAVEFGLTPASLTAMARANEAPEAPGGPARLLG